MPTNTIPLQALELVLQKIITNYAQRGITSVDVTAKDFYLAISTREMFDMHRTPSEPHSVGSLADDLAELEKLLIEPDRMATVVDIERLGNVLRAVSEFI